MLKLGEGHVNGAWKIVESRVLVKLALRSEKVELFRHANIILRKVKK